MAGARDSVKGTHVLPEAAHPLQSPAMAGGGLLAVETTTLKTVGGRRLFRRADVERLGARRKKLLK